MNLLNWLQTPRYPLIAALILVIGAAWVGISGTIFPPEAPLSIAAPQAGFLAPDFTLLDAAGNQVQLSSLRGKAVMINFWASWCTPCRAEMPDIQHIYEQYTEKGLVVLGVNSTSQDDAKTALKFAQDYGLNFPILFDVDGDAARKYQVRALPSTFFIGPDGTIKEVVIGGPMAPALLQTRVERLLEEIP